MRKTLFVVGTLALMLVLPSSALAQNPSTSGTLAVSASVDSSMSVSFASAAAGITLGGTATAASMGFGNISAYGSINTSGVTRTEVVDGTSFTVSSPVKVLVYGANVPNGIAAGYTLTAKIDSLDADNSWKFAGVDLKDGDSHQITNTGVFGVLNTTVAITVPFTLGTGGINKTITLTATAN